MQGIITSIEALWTSLPAISGYLYIHMVLPFVIIITCNERHFVVFAVHMLDSETTKAAYSSIARAVVRTGKTFIVAAAMCATACLAICRATAAHYIQKCPRSNWSCWYRRSDDGSVDAPIKVGNVSICRWARSTCSCRLASGGGSFFNGGGFFGRRRSEHERHSLPYSFSVQRGR